MEIRFTIPTSDLQLINDNLDYINSLFDRFKILSDHFMVEDETFVEYTDGSFMFDWKEVVIQIDSINNFWQLAKVVQLLKFEKTS